METVQKKKIAKTNEMLRLKEKNCVVAMLKLYTDGVFIMT